MAHTNHSRHANGHIPTKHKTMTNGTGKRSGESPRSTIRQVISSFPSARRRGDVRQEHLFPQWQKTIFVQLLQDGTQQIIIRK